MLTQIEQRPPPRTRRSAAPDLVRLVAAAVLPLLAFIIGLAFLYGERQRTEVESAIQARLRETRAHVDALISAQVTALEAIAASTNLDSPNLPAFRAELQRIMTISQDWWSLVLIDPRTAQQIVTTREAGAQQLPLSGNPESIFEAVRTQRPQASSGLFHGGNSGEWLIAVRVPVLRRGEVAFVLSASLTPAIFARAFAELPSDWTGAILDADNRIVMRSQKSTEFIGQAATSSLVEQFGRANAGSFIATDKDGRQLFTTYIHPRQAPWTIVIGAPMTEIELLQQRSWLVVGAAGLAMVAITIGIAVILGRASARRREIEEQLSRLEAENQVFDIATRNRELERSRAALALSESRSRAIANNAADGIMTLDEKGLIQTFNNAAERLFDFARTETVGEPATMLVIESERGEFENLLGIHRVESGRPPTERAFTGRRKSGTTFALELRLAAFEFRGQVLFTITARNIAERLRMQEQLRQAQRIEAVGQLTGGLAHDFNNLLTVILGNLSLISEASTSQPVQRFTAAARRAAERGERLTSQLLAFGRRQFLRPHAMSLNRVIHQIEPLIRHALGEAVALEIVLQEDLWPCVIDEGGLEVMLLNLVVNSRDAIPENGGVVTIRTRNSPAVVNAGAASKTTGQDEEPAPESLVDHVEISVRDNGTGMAEDVRARAFEPFFTTKEVGRGSGLGLSQVYGFVQQSNGVIRLESTPGIGTEVLVLIPRTRPATAEAGSPGATDTPASELSASGGSMSGGSTPAPPSHIGENAPPNS